MPKALSVQVTRHAGTEDAAETITPPDIEPCDRGWIDHRPGSGRVGRTFEISRWVGRRCGAARTCAVRAADGAGFRSASGPTARGGSYGSTNTVAPQDLQAHRSVLSSVIGFRESAPFMRSATAAPTTVRSGYPLWTSRR